MLVRPLLLAALLSLASLHAAPEYKFSLEGEPFHPRILPVMGERLGVPARGDVGRVRDFPFVLQEPGHYRFCIREPNRLFARIDDGPERCVAVRMVGRSPVATNPLDSIPAAERKHLWGVHLETIPSLWPDALRGIDWSRAILSFSGELPRHIEFPANLHYFSYQSRDIPTIVTPARNYLLKDLRYLNIELRAGDELSAEPISQATHLRNLDLKGGSLTDLQTLGANRHLRFLKIRSVRGLDSLKFTRQLPKLRVLKVDETEVADLAPLAGLKDLRLLSVNATAVADLPPLDALPTLRDFRLHSTPLAKKKNFIAPLRPKMNVLVKNWEPSIRAFEQRVKETPPPKDPLLFIGSSSIRKWDLEKSFPGLPTLNRGFGGSELSDALRYFDRIVLPYRPRAILLYGGDNDINKGETAKQVIADYKTFTAKVRRQLPDTHFGFLPIKPSLKRWDLWPEMNEANQKIRLLAEADAHLHYLDTATPMLGDNEMPRPELFAKDGLHLSESGYALWSEVVAAWFKDILK